MMEGKITYRKAAQDDASHLAILSDSATRRLSSFLWSMDATPGRSWLEIGREVIGKNCSHTLYFDNWMVVEIDGQVAGAINGYALPRTPTDAAFVGETNVITPLIELRSIASRSWYISAVSVFPEYRNKGIGNRLLSEAQITAARQGENRLTLMVGSFNREAQRLYSRFGFSEMERRSFIPFFGSDIDGEWILMINYI